MLFALFRLLFLSLVLPLTPLLCMEEDEFQRFHLPAKNPNDPGYSKLKTTKLLDKLQEKIELCLKEEQEKLNPNAYRDCFIKGATKVGIEYYFCKDLRAFIGLKLSEGLGAAADNLRGHNPCGPAPQSGSLSQTYLYNVCQSHHLRSVASLDALALPARLCSLVTKTVANMAISAADKAKITDATIKAIAYNAQHFITNSAPQAVKNGYQQWVSKSKAKYDTWKEKILNIGQQPANSEQQKPNSAQEEHVKRIVIQEVAQSFKEHEQEISRQFSRYLKANRELKEAERAEQADVQERIKKVQQFVASEEEFSIMRDTLATSFQGIASIAYAFGNKGTAQKIGMFGGSAIKLLSDMHLIATHSTRTALGIGLSARSYDLMPLAAFGTNAPALGASSLSTTLSAVMPYIGIATTIASLIGFLNDNDDDTNNPYEAVIQAINESINQAVHHISELLNQFHKDVMERFDGIERYLEAHHRAMLQGFFALHQENQDIKRAIRSLAQTLKAGQERAQESLNYAHQLMQNNQQALLDAFRFENLKDTEKLVKKALYETESNILDNEKFEENVKNLYIEAITTAQQPNVTGSAIDPLNFDAVDNALTSSAHSQSLWGHSAFSFINLLTNFTQRHCNTQPTRLVNPLMWIRCTETLIQILQTRLQNDPQYPRTEEHRRLTLSRLKTIFDEGENILKFIGHAYNAKVVRDLFNRYQETVKELIAHIQHASELYEQRRTEELRAEHRKIIEAEKMAVQNQPAVEHPKAFNQVAVLQPVIKFQSIPQSTYLSGCVSKYMQEYVGPVFDIFKFPWEGLTKNFDVRFTLYTHGRSITLPNTAERMTTPVNNGASHLLSSQQFTQNIQAKAKANFEEFKQAIEGVGNRYIQATAVKLFTQAQQAQPLSRQMHAQEGEPYSMKICIPGDLKIPEVYLLAENLKLGSLRVEYKMTQSHFTLLVYFITPSGIKNLLFTHSKQHTLSAPYSNEDIDNYWNGGWYSKSQDKVTAQIESYWVKPQASLPLIAPETYPAERATFVAQSQRTDAPNFAAITTALTQDLKNAQAQERISFNNEEKKEATAAGSILFKLLQKLDVYFKVLDSLLALTYSNDYQNREQFKALRADHLLYLKNKQAILHYLTHYAQNNQLSKELDYLPEHLAKTIQAVKTTINTIEGLQLRPHLQHIERILEQLRNLLFRYQERVILPAQPQERRVPEQSPQLQALLESNRILQQKATESQEEVKLMRKQMGELQEQMKIMMQLLAKK